MLEEGGGRGVSPHQTVFYNYLVSVSQLLMSVARLLMSVSQLWLSVSQLSQLLMSVARLLKSVSQLSQLLMSVARLLTSVAGIYISCLAGFILYNNRKLILAFTKIPCSDKKLQTSAASKSSGHCPKNNLNLF